MKYGDSPSEPPPSSHMSEPQTCPAIKPRDSESYGSLHTDDESEDGALHQLKDAVGFGQTKGSDNHVDTEEQQLMTGAVETNNQSKHTRTRFCVVLWAGDHLLNGYKWFINQSAVYLTRVHCVLHQLARFPALSTFPLSKCVTLWM